MHSGGMYKRSTDMDKQYYPSIDIIKGVAILLVILGHSFCTFPFDLNSQFPYLGDIVRSFQMQLFFLVSGFLFSTNSDFVTFIRNKTNRLIIPLLTFGVISISLKYAFSRFTHGGEINILNGLYDIIQGHYYWFLYSLMWIMLFVFVIKKSFLLLAACTLSILCCILTDIKDVQFFTIGRTIYYLPFFSLGLFFHQFSSAMKKYFKNVKNYILLLAVTVFIYAISVKMEDASKLIVLYIMPLTGSILTCGIVLLLSKYTSLSMNGLKHFGRYSLQYYLNHLLIMLPIYYVAGMITPPYLQLLTIWTVAIIVSFIMLNIEKRIKWLRYLCGLKP